MALVITKIDLAMELLEDLLGVIQGECDSIVHVRAAVRCIVLALSGYIHDVLAQYKCYVDSCSRLSSRLIKKLQEERIESTNNAQQRRTLEEFVEHDK